MVEVEPSIESFHVLDRINRDAALSYLTENSWGKPPDAVESRTIESSTKPLAPLVPGQPDRCLLARHVASVTGAFSTLAGFIEIGESLEEAVRREIAEEAGVQLGTVTYQASQPWPFPSGLMIGFRARALSEEVCVDGAELAEARWFTRSELSAEIASGRQRRPDSIESHLIDTWLRGD